MNNKSTKGGQKEKHIQYPHFYTFLHKPRLEIKTTTWWHVFSWWQSPLQSWFWVVKYIIKKSCKSKQKPWWTARSYHGLFKSSLPPININDTLPGKIKLSLNPESEIHEWHKLAFNLNNPKNEQFVSASKHQAAICPLRSKKILCMLWLFLTRLNVKPEKCLMECNQRWSFWSWVPKYLCSLMLKCPV